MDHPTHRLSAYCDNRRRVVFCSLCGKEEDEGLEKPCAKTFYVDKIDATPYPEFVSGLP